MKSIRLFAAMSLLLLWGATFSGCSESSAVDTQQVQKYRTTFALEQEPDGAQTVLQVRESLGGGAATHDHAHDHDAGSAHHEEGKADNDPAGHDEAGHDQAEDAALAEDADHDEGTVPGHDEHPEHDPNHTQGEKDEEDAHHEESQGEADDHEHAGHDHAERGHEGHDHSAHDHAAHGGGEARDVVMVGMVGGLPNAATQTLPEFPFVKDYAIVMLADPLAVVELEEGGHNHAPGEECSFCAAHAGDQSNFLATVKFTNDSGEVLSIDARKLFDLKEKDVVVVRGKARLDHDGTLVVDATGLYVRR